VDVVDAAARDRWALGPEYRRHPPVYFVGLIEFLHGL
jgi:hypothetical protein